jgi:hypothetical protein
MATLNEIAHDLLGIVRPQLSDDSELDLRQIKFWIHNQRALFIRNELNRSRTIDPAIIQTICVELEEVDASDCCDITLDCPILRSTKVLPDTIELHNSQGITRVAPINVKSAPFSHVEKDRIPFVAEARFTGNMIYTFRHNGYLYVYTKNPRYKNLAAASVSLVAEDPTAAATFKDCTTAENPVPCYTDDMEYPIKAWMIPGLKQSILQSNLMVTAQAEQQQADEANNAKSDAAPIQ